jgi:hypothetical protein
MGTLKRYSKALGYEYRVKTAALGTLKRYYIFSLTLYIAWCSTYSIHRGGPTAGQQRAREVLRQRQSGQWRAPLANQRKNVITHKPKI